MVTNAYAPLVGRRAKMSCLSPGAEHLLKHIGPEVIFGGHGRIRKNTG